jgi:hypothetical protein
MAPFTVGWDPVLRAFVLTLVVMPLAVSLVVPRLMSIYDRYLAPRDRLSEVCSRSGLTTDRGPQNRKDQPDADDRRLRRRRDVR